MLTNPFQPAFGKVPQVMIDRSERAADIAQRIAGYDGMYQTTMIYGQRGVGKTVLMTEIGNLVKKQKNSTNVVCFL